MWYRKAAEQGYADAQYKLAYMYDFGLGVRASVAEATKWLRRAAEQGHAEARRTLASSM
jgi:TPR repeat protein